MNYYISDLHLFHEAAIRFETVPSGIWRKCIQRS